ncbi:hypothetical protein JCM10212_000064 [Sporobolomyces blumeae]
MELAPAAVRAPMDEHLSERTPLLQPAPIPELLPALPPSLARRDSTSSSSSTSSVTSHVAPIDSALSLPQLVRILAALKAGHVPSSRQLIDLADALLASPLLASDPHGTLWQPRYGKGRLGTGSLTRNGDKVRLAAREFVKSAKDLVKRRNPEVERRRRKGKEREVELVGREDEPGDAWQEFYWSTKMNEVELKLPASTPPPPLKLAASVVSSSLLSLVTLFLTSIEMRQLLIDFVVLLRDAAQVVLERESTDDRLPQDAKDAVEKVVDLVAERTVETVALGEGMKEENVKKVQRDRGDPVVPGEARDAAGGEKVGADDPPLVDIGASPTTTNDDPFDDSTPVLPDQSPEEIRDAFVDRLKEILQRLQATPQYQSAMQTLLDAVRDYVRKSLDSLTPKVSVHPSPSAEASSRHPAPPAELLVPLLEPFTGGPGSLSPLRQSFHATLSHLATSNPESAPHAIRTLGAEFDRYLTRAFLEPGFVESSVSNRQLGTLYDAISRLGQDQPAFYRDLQAFFRLLFDATSRIAHDPVLARAALATKDLSVALEGWVEAVGTTTAKAASGEGVAALWGDVLEWIAPRLLGVVREIPMPRIEFASPTVSGAIEAPSLFSTSFVPASITFQNSTSFTYLPTLGSSSQDIPIHESHPPDRQLSHTTIADRTTYASRTSISLSGLRLEIVDVGYFVKVHTGIPCLSVSESGLLDLHFGTHPDGGAGFSLDTSSEPSQVAQDESLFKVLPSSTVTLQHFDVRSHDSSHPWLMFLLRPIIRTAVRKAVEVELRKVLIEQGDKLGEWTYRVKEHKRKVDRDSSDGRGEREKDRVWSWVKAVWATLTEQLTDEDDWNEHQQGAEPAQIGTEIHLNRHGVAVDLPRPVDTDSSATVGIGREGVVIPEGDAPIPPPPGTAERIGPVAKAKEELDEAVESGRNAARKTWDVVGGIGEASEEWTADVEAEREAYRRDGWRSEAFDLRG